MQINSGKSDMIDEERTSKLAQVGSGRSSISWATCLLDPRHAAQPPQLYLLSKHESLQSAVCFVNKEKQIESDSL